MKIDFVRSGGFAGLSLKARFNTKSLAVDEASHLDALVQAAGFFDLPEQSPADAPGADRYQYRLTISAKQGTHSIACDETQVPDRVRPLLDYLAAVALRRRKASSDAAGST